MSEPEEVTNTGSRDDLTARIAVLNAEVARLKREEAARTVTDRQREKELTDAEGRVKALSERNNKLTVTLRDARAQLLQLKEEVDRLAQPPSGYGVFIAPSPDNTVEVYTGGRRMRLSVSPTV
ncbi:MAG: hypothetical protein WBP12_05660, partial [Candidatus Saccharimonas sp.]